MSFLSIQHISKSFDGKAMLNDISLEIRQGDFYSLLGPSGCGKTTLLRIIAGLETPTAGHIMLAGKEITNLPPQKRNIGFVFQNYALFPSMTVAENVAYGLGLRKENRQTINRKVDEVLQKMKIGHKRDQKVAQLSGGEQQRVSLARVIVTEPELILFDEPLSNLDYMLRLEARTELKRLQKDLGTTSVFVTHDQLEALALSDELALLNKGFVAQAGKPSDVYFSPQNQFVADFVGHYNFFETIEAQTCLGLSVPKEKVAAVLPEHIAFLPAPDGRLTIAEVLFNGAFTEYIAEDDNGKSIRSLQPASRKITLTNGTRVACNTHPAQIILLDKT